MQKAKSLQGKWRHVVFLLIALLIAGADQLSKIWIRSYPEEPPIFEIGFFQLTHAHNTGAAFGLFQGQSLPLTIVAIIGIAAIIGYTLLIHHRSPLLNTMLSKVALGLVLGGTAGNLIDRLRLGHVTDFIDFKVWPAFNVADAAVTVTRLARGLPTGGQIEYANKSILADAISNRREI